MGQRFKAARIPRFKSRGYICRCDWCVRPFRRKRQKELAAKDMAQQFADWKRSP